MRIAHAFACLGVMLSCAHSTYAADRIVMLPLQDAVNAATAAGKLDGSVKFYMGNNAGPRGRVVQSGIVTNEKTNAVGKADSVACAWAAQSALIQLQKAAKAAGATAVTNIVSYYQKKVTSDPVNYECHAGAVIAGVALRGDLVVP
jgi:uncharacterized protein YbjQ (UPF0145 family)